MQSTLSYIYANKYNNAVFSLTFNFGNFFYNMNTFYEPQSGYREH